MQQYHTQDQVHKPINIKLDKFFSCAFNHLIYNWEINELLAISIVLNLQ